MKRLQYIEVKRSESHRGLHILGFRFRFPIRIQQFQNIRLRIIYRCFIRWCYVLHVLTCMYTKMCTRLYGHARIMTTLWQADGGINVPLTGIKSTSVVINNDAAGARMWSTPLPVVQPCVLAPRASNNRVYGTPIIRTGCAVYDATPFVSCTASDLWRGIGIVLRCWYSGGWLFQASRSDFVQ